MSAPASTAENSSATSTSEPAPSPPSEPEGYRDAIDKALAELSLGHFSESRAMFMRAHRLHPNARTLRGLGLAEFELRSYVDCVDHLSQSLASDRNPLQGELRRETEELLERARSYVAELSLQVKPEDVELRVDGTITPFYPDRSLVLPAGEHRLSLAAAGYRSIDRTFTALAGEKQRLSLTLLPETRPTRDEEQQRELVRNPWLWTGVAAVVAGATATALVLAMRRDRQDEDPYGGTSRVSIPTF